MSLVNESEKDIQGIRAAVTGGNDLLDKVIPEEGEIIPPEPMVEELPPEVVEAPTEELAAPEGEGAPPTEAAPEVPAEIPPVEEKEDNLTPEFLAQLDATFERLMAAAPSQQSVQEPVQPQSPSPQPSAPAQMVQPPLTPAPAVMPAQPQELTIPQDVYDQAMQNPQALANVLAQYGQYAVQQALVQARQEIQQQQQQLRQEMQGFVVQQNEALSVFNTYLDANPELKVAQRPFRIMINDVARQHQDWTPQQVFKEAHEELKKLAKESRKAKASGPKPAIQVPTGGAASRAPQKLSAFEIDKRKLAAALGSDVQ